MIEMAELTKRYGGSNAVDALSFTVRPGQVTGFLPTSNRSPADERIDALTSREREVLVELARGRSNKEIGQRVFISEATVKVHVAHILAKLCLRDRAQVIVFAYENGVVRPGDDGV